MHSCLHFVLRGSLSCSFARFRSRLAGVAAGVLVLAAAGCATGDIAMMATISGGQKIRVPLSRAGAELVNEGGIQMNTATFTLNADKKIVYIFEFTDAKKRALRNVKVEDESDAAPVMVLESTQPTLSATGQWKGESEPLTLSDPRLGWMATLPNTLRVFRVTVTFADGRTQVIHQGSFFPAVMKSAVRQTLGQNY
jgi:hypothetical protein